MSSFSLRILGLFASLLFLSGQYVAGQAPETEDELVAGWQNYYLDVASGYRFEVGARELEWIKKPVLTYTNPVRGRQQHGGIFVWTDQGRPAALASIWSITDLRSPETRITAHELVSLASEQLVATRPSPETLRPGVDPTWSCEDAGIQWSPIELLGGQNAGGELSISRASLQMRSFARRFRAEVVRRSDRSISNLRMLETPVYRYESDSKQRIGGLFAFALATDPELFVWLEYDRKQGKWRYAPVRLSLLDLTLFLDETEVWTEPDLKEKTNAAYGISFRVREFPADTPPTTNSAN